MSLLQLRHTCLFASLHLNMMDFMDLFINFLKFPLSVLATVTTILPV